MIAKFTLPPSPSRQYSASPTSLDVFSLASDPATRDAEIPLPTRQIKVPDTCIIFLTARGDGQMDGLRRFDMKIMIAYVDPVLSACTVFDIA